MQAKWIIRGVLVAALSAAPLQAAGLVGTVWDGACDYPDEVFIALEQALREDLAAGAGSYGPHVEGVMAGLFNPKGPLGAARVMLRSADGAAAGRQYETRSDTNGLFEFNEVETGRYALTIYRARLAGTEETAETWQLNVPSPDDYSDRNTRVQLVFPSERITARGRVTDDQGRPLAGVAVKADSYAYDGEINTWPAEAHVVTALTDAEGHYTLPGLHPSHLWHVIRRGADYALYVSADGYASALEPLKVVTPATLRAAQRMFSMFRTAEAQRSPDAMDEMIVWPTPADGRTKTIQVPDIRLSRAAAVGGRVLDADGASLTNALVSLQPRDDVPHFQPLREQGFTSIRSAVDRAGRFLFRGLPPGHYNFSVDVSGRSVRFPDAPIALAAAGVVTNLEFTYAVPITGSIQAAVRDSVTGEPITNYYAYVEKIDAQPPVGWSSGRLEVLRDNRQQFVVSDLSPGRAVIRIEAPGYVMQKVPCDVVSGITTELPIALLPGGTALIRVTRNGVLIKPYQILAWPDGARESLYWRKRVDDRGAAVFTNLPPGLNRLRVVDLVPEPNRHVLGEVVIEAGKTNVVELEDVTEATLAIRATFPPTMSVRVWIEPAAAPVMDSFEANYALLAFEQITRSGQPVSFALPAGTYRISAQRLEGTQAAEQLLIKADQHQVIQLGTNRAETVSFAL